MAELAKKLHFLKSGTEQTAKAYSTTGEAGDNYVPLKIDGVACYAPIGSTDDAMATNGRVIKGGTTYAIKSQAKPPYAEVSYTTAGTHTFTVPNGVTRLRVACIGGGAGGFCSWNPYNLSDQYQYGGHNAGTLNFTSGAGGNSSFGSLINATGATGTYFYMKIVWAEDSDGRYLQIADGPVYTPSTAGSPNGNAGTYAGSYASNSTSPLAGGAGFALSFTQTTGTYGEGGQIVGSYHKWIHRTSGSSGGYNSGYVTVTPGTTYTITVGAGGEPGGERYSGYAYAGASGAVLVAYGGDI